MSRYKIKVCTDLTEIAPGEWNRVVQTVNGSVFYSHQWLQAYTRAAPHQSQPFYLLAYHQKQLVGILPAYLTQNCPRLTAHRQYLVTPQTTLGEPMLLAHSLYSYYGGPLTKWPDGELLTQITAEFEHLARDLDVEVYGFVNFYREDGCLLGYFRQQGYVGRFLSSAMYLPVVWSRFDEYLGHFRSKRRRNIRGMARKARQLGVRAEYVTTPPAMADMDRLMKQILHKHGHVDVNLYPTTYLQAISEDMGEAAKYLLIYSPDGKLICFFLVLDNQVHLTPWVAGIDYETLEHYEPYHFAYRWLINYAITHHYQGIDFGRSAYNFKRRYGCIKRDLSLVLNTPYQELRPELDRWSRALARFEGNDDGFLWEEN
jgi:predicted N-acyltransferase